MKPSYNNHRLQNSKKSQTELLGFAIVVLLISVGMLFVISFLVSNSDSDSRETYLLKQMATNYNDALLETTTTCRQLSVRELYLACVDSDSTICPEQDGSNSNTVTSCTYLKEFISQRLDQTLDEWGYDFAYSYRFDDLRASPVFTHSNLNSAQLTTCKRQRSPLILTADSSQIIIYLDMYSCRE